MEQYTHHKINPTYSGEIIELDANSSVVQLITTSVMIVDDSGLVHGGFIFSLADFAAMVAVNHPNVVLAGASVRFLKPVKKGDKLIARAKVEKDEGKKKLVKVVVKKDEDKIFEGDFSCYVPIQHVLIKEKGE